MIIQLPEVTHYGVLDMQVCVPESWTDEQILAFAEKKFPCGTTNGWFIRRQADYDKAIAEGKVPREGCHMKERIACDDRPGFIHVMLDA